MALDGLSVPLDRAPFGGEFASNAGSGDHDDDENLLPPLGPQPGSSVENDDSEAAFGLNSESESHRAPDGHPDFLTFDEIELIDGPVAAKGGTKGKPTDSSGLGGGNGGGNGKHSGTTTTTDSGTTTTPLDSYVSGGDAATSYNVEIDFQGTWTSALQKAFVDAANFLSSTILSDIPDALGSDGSVIDDIRISATLQSIDGPGGILGQAGPTYVRMDSWLPTEASMEFDSADAQNYLDSGNWYDIVLHEMLHSIGFGTVWNLMGLTTGSIAGGDLRFTGANATEAYQNEFAAIANNDPNAALGVPVETDGGSGTAGGHWDEATFDGEIMTGYLDNSTFISNMTIAALEDMGYDTVYDSLMFA